jgi:hypothetical protein
MRSGFGGRAVGVGLWSRSGEGGLAETATTGSTAPEPRSIRSLFSIASDDYEAALRQDWGPVVEAPAAAFETDGTSFWQSSAVL